MEKKHRLSLYIFRRDIRLTDNHGLNAALQHSKSVIPCFIFDPQQVKSNEYKSDNALQFMINSLNELQKKLKAKKGKFYFFYGQPHKVIETIIKETSIDAIYVNADYTPFSRQRDISIKKSCDKYTIQFHSLHTHLLNTPETILKKDGTPYTIFTPFYKKALNYPVSLPEKLHGNNFYTKPIKSATHNIPKEVTYKENAKVFVKGGSREAKKLVKNLSSLENYAKMRDFPHLYTSKLSAHHKFGTLSIRESYYEIIDSLGEEHPLLRQLYWRDFFTHIAFFFPHVFESAFHQKYNRIRWSTSKKKFDAWCGGTTGFPIVDAGMKELNETGYMHNRVRMITASFLVKDLHIHWQWGEKYFAQKLVDYDPSVNNGNWQWAASTGCDATPYFRIFNPWTQQKKFDPQALYIKKWIPELKHIAIKNIHSLEKNTLNILNYPQPIIDHSIERLKTLELFKKARI